MNRIGKNGFTLIELLIAMAIASIVGTVIASSYLVQVRGKRTQEALTDMNQAARGAFEIMEDEIRLVGLDPTKDAPSRIVVANDGELIFSMDRGDGATNRPDGDCCDANEVIRYHLTNDANNDGVNDNIVNGVECNLGRETGGGLDPSLNCHDRSGLQTLSPNIDVLNFVYLTNDDNGDGQLDVVPTPVATQAARDTIRYIQVTIVARAGTESRGLTNQFTNNEAYFNINPDGEEEVLPALHDHFRRLRLATTIKCRNVGL
jgi:type IV pilus assembly protein PilW